MRNRTARSRLGQKEPCIVFPDHAQAFRSVAPGVCDARWIWSLTTIDAR